MCEHEPLKRTQAQLHIELSTPGASPQNNFTEYAPTVNDQGRYPEPFIFDSSSQHTHTPLFTSVAVSDQSDLRYLTSVSSSGKHSSNSFFACHSH